MHLDSVEGCIRAGREGELVFWQVLGGNELTEESRIRVEVGGEGVGRSWRSG